MWKQPSAVCMRVACNMLVHFHLSVRRCSMQTSEARTVVQAWVCQVIIGCHYSRFVANRLSREFCACFGQQIVRFRIPSCVSLLHAYDSLWQIYLCSSTLLYRYVLMYQCLGVQDRLLHCFRAPEVVIVTQWERQRYGQIKLEQVSCMEFAKCYNCSAGVCYDAYYDVERFLLKYHVTSFFLECIRSNSLDFRCAQVRRH
jgi:hypothetical protein